MTESQLRIQSKYAAIAILDEKKWFKFESLAKARAFLIKDLQPKILTYEAFSKLSIDEMDVIVENLSMVYSDIGKVYAGKKRQAVARNFDTLSNVRPTVWLAILRCCRNPFANNTKVSEQPKYAAIRFIMDMSNPANRLWVAKQAPQVQQIINWLFDMLMNGVGPDGVTGQWSLHWIKKQIEDDAPISTKQEQWAIFYYYKNKLIDNQVIMYIPGTYDNWSQRKTGGE